MADVKISELSAAGALSGTEVLPVVQGGVTKKATTQAVANLVDISGKADTADVDAALALKANSSDVTTALALKANASDVTTSLALKADTTALTSGLAGKADTSHVHSAADITTGVLAVARGGTGTATPGLVQGTNVTITGTWPNQTINASGGSGSSAWGGITGTLSDQTDLNSALAAKAPLASPTFTGTVSGITKSMVGLGNVDNTADTAKPVSTAQQTALDLKANLASPTFTGTVSGITKSMVGLGNVDNTADASKPVSTAQAAADAAVAATAANATNLTSGTIPAGRYGTTTIPVSAVNATGTASSTTYLRGDGTWSTPSGGGSGDMTLGGNSTAGDYIYGTLTNQKVVLKHNNVVQGSWQGSGRFYSPDEGSYYRLANNLFEVSAGSGFIGVGSTNFTALASGKYLQWTGGILNLEGDMQLQNGLAGVAKEASARLQVDSTTKGALLPRMTSTQRDAIASPAEGLEIYNLTTHEKNFWNGTGWRKLTDTAA